MKNKFLNMLALVAIVGLVFTSCGDDTPEPKPKPDPKPDPNSKTENLSGSITGTKKLDSKKEYFLTGSLIVEKGGTLEIPAGMTIKARKGFSNYILVLAGGKININGTKDKPVTITADKKNPGEGYWGGLIINGNAKLTYDPKKKQYSTGATEINSAYLYGGTKDNDSSGSITYLKLMYTGARSSGKVEHNGLTLNGVGNGTKIENVYVYEPADDGIEFFGGSVNVKNLLVVNSDDDMFDITQGWSGTLDNCYGIWEKGYKSSEGDPRGVEADGNLDGKLGNHTNQSDFTIKNMTIDLQLDPSTGKGLFMHDVVKVRRGAKGNITNALVKGAGQAKDLVDLKDGRGNANPSTVVNITNSLSTALSGKKINGTGKVTVKAGNTGAKKSVFGWTGYKFK